MPEESGETPKTSNGEQGSSNYDRALALMQYHAQLSWLVFGPFLLTETVLLAAIAAMMKTGPDPSFLFGGAVLGLALILPWWASFRQNHQYYLLRMEQAKEFENAPGNFLAEGKALYDGKRVHGLRMPWLSRVLPPGWGVACLVIAFAVAFLATAVANAPWGRPTDLVAPLWAAIVVTIVVATGYVLKRLIAFFYRRVERLVAEIMSDGAARTPPEIKTALRQDHQCLGRVPGAIDDALASLADKGRLHIRDGKYQPKL